MGGTRQVPAPDPVATDYLLLVLRLDQHLPGLIDGYFGPAALKAQVDMEQLRAPARLRDDAAALRERIATEIAEPDRRAWLDAQLVALEAQAAAAAGETSTYVDLVTRCMGVAPTRIDDEALTAARATIDDLLPGDIPLADRLAAWDQSLEIRLDRVPAVVDWLVSRFRAAAARDFGLPAGEDLRVTLVRNQPWTAYNWYDGGRRSRVDINTDRPVHAPGIIRTMAHETYPGHHLEQAWKEADLVDTQGRLEASVLTIDTPECVISEGLANLGVAFAAPPADEADLLVEVFDRADLPVSRDRAAARAAAERCVALGPARRTLGAIGGNAALLRHADGWSHDDVRAYLEEAGGATPEIATRRLEFIEHPRWRRYVFVYAEGEAMLRAWVDAVPEADRVARFGRLLHEQLPPATILAEVRARG